MSTERAIFEVRTVIRKAICQNCGTVLILVNLRKTYDFNKTVQTKAALEHSQLLYTTPRFPK